MSDNLPEYKQTFLREMEELRRKELFEQEEQNQQALRSTLRQAEQVQAPMQHELWNQSQYSDVNQYTKVGELAQQFDADLLPTRAQ